MVELREQRRWCGKIARALGLDPDSPRAVVVREILLARIFSSAMNKSRRTGALLKEFQQAMKAVPNDPAGARKKSSPEGQNLRQHLEQLYGPGVVVVEDVDDE